MVAYSFQRQFTRAIRMGLKLEPEILDLTAPQPKRQTVRKVGRRRHARPNEQLQLYVGMRTKNCVLLGRACCTEVQKIEIHFRNRRNCDWLRCPRYGKLDRPSELNRFAVADGFADWLTLREFWAKHHPGVRDFRGVIIFWEPL